MVVRKAERLACYALVVQVYFACPALSFVSFSTSTVRTKASVGPLPIQSNYNPDDPGPPPFTEYQFNATSLPPPEELPDDLPKDVSKEQLDEAISSRQKTLYETLGASPTATRSELKKKYVEMAKLSHPDAQIGRSDMTGDMPDFGEVAAAWRVLGDTKSRKRYDRELQYKKWSEYASNYANEKLEEAVPAVAKIMDDVAVPFIRRTAATTFAVSNAMSKLGRAASKRGSKEDSSTNGDSGGESLTDAFMNAIKAGRKAGRAIDSLELNEKSEQLSERAQNDEMRARQVAEQLNEVTEKRLFATLQSEDVTLSSDEAKIVLDRIAANEMEIDEYPNGLDRIEKEIEALQETEQQFMEKLELYEETDREWNELLDRQETAKRDLTQRKQEEVEARRRLEEAINLVSEAKANLVTTSNALRNIEQRVRRNASEMDRVTFTLSKKQERVRHALRRKADMASGGIQVEYLSTEEVAALRRKEMQLAGESEQLAQMVARLSSRAEKLKSRADALDRYQRTEKNPQNNGGSWNGAMQP